MSFIIDFLIGIKTQNDKVGKRCAIDRFSHLLPLTFFDSLLFFSQLSLSVISSILSLFFSIKVPVLLSFCAPRPRGRIASETLVLSVAHKACAQVTRIKKAPLKQLNHFLLMILIFVIVFFSFEIKTALKIRHVIYY